MIKYAEFVELKYKYCRCFFEHTNFKNDFIECKHLCCSKINQQKFDANLKEEFFNTYRFSKHDNNKFI